MSFATRQMGNLAKPNLIISVEDDGVISMKAESTLKTTAIQFKLNEEFDETTADGRNAKVGHSVVKVFLSYYPNSSTFTYFFFSFSYPSVHLHR